MRDDLLPPPAYRCTVRTKLGCDPTVSGTQCTRRAQAGSDRCDLHREQEWACPDCGHSIPNRCDCTTAGCPCCDVSR